MKINVYLPDEIGDKAKEAGLNLSRLLRSAVEDELSKLEAHEELLREADEVELSLLDDDGRRYTGRFIGSLIAGGRNCAVYFSEHNELGRRILVHDLDKDSVFCLDDPADLEDLLYPEDYIETMHALGETPVVSI